MLKNQRAILNTTATALILALIGSIAVYAEDNLNSSSLGNVTIETASATVQGEVHITGTNETDKNVKLFIKKDGIIGKWYDVRDGKDIDQTIELIDGEGIYNIYAMIHFEGNKYAYGPSIIVSNTEYSTKTVVQESTNDISSGDTSIAELSKRLTADKKTSREKIEAIYNWVAENLTYDYEKYNNMLAKDFSGQYGATVAFESKKGVCYDYAKLFVELCSASGIQAKVDAGYCTNIIGYHAWNEVFDADSSQWLILDTTVDSINYHKTGKTVEMVVRAESEYAKTSEM